MPKTVLITGCSAGGIGHALAKEYHARGLHVFATARRLETLSELKSLGIETLYLDVTKEDSIASLKDTISQSTGGKLDILVNNAGKGQTMASSDVTAAQARDLFETNFISVVAMCTAFIPLLAASENGRIVNIGSIAGIMPLPFGSTYNASKAALHAYGNTLRVDLKPFNIDVITIITGAVLSNIAANNPSDIPSESMFYGMRDLFIKLRKGVSQTSGLPTHIYAKQVVTKTLKRTPSAWVWAGNTIWPVWLLNTFGSVTAFDFILRRRFGLLEFARRLTNQKKQA